MGILPVLCIFNNRNCFLVDFIVIFLFVGTTLIIHCPLVHCFICRVISGDFATCTQSATGIRLENDGGFTRSGGVGSTRSN